MGRNQRDETTVLRGGIGSDVSFTPAEGIITSNGTANVTISNVAPAGVTTDTIALWLSLVYNGTTYYIPMWT
jgi:hypothetical protein